MLWALVAIYAIARVLQIYPDKVPMPAIVLLHVLPPAIFALLHGRAIFGLRGILTFAGICLGTGFAFETLGVLTGFPFGHYYFTDVMGPKLYQTPVLLALAYLGMGYLAWTLAGIILRTGSRPFEPLRLIALPLVAAFIMVSWDLAMEAVWATLLRAWVWRDGGPWFGVPVTNFLGWYLTVWVFYQAFAIYLRRHSPTATRLPPIFWKKAVAFYAASAAGNVLLLTRQRGPTVVTDPSGAHWRTADITASAALASIFVMGAFALLAWLRLPDRAASAGTIT